VILVSSAERRGARGRAAVAALLALGVAASWWHIDFALSALFDRSAARAVAALLSDANPPELSPSFLAVVAAAAWRTLALALVGTAGAVALGVPLGALASLQLWRRGPLRGDASAASRALMAGTCALVRALLRLLRAVPDVAWALLFVVALGLGPLPGALALAVSGAGVLGRVAGELFDVAPVEPQRALRAAGASRWQIFAFAMWPTAARPIGGYIVYTFECAVRAAAVLGFVGGGGLGHEIALSLRMFEYGQVATLLAATLALLLLGEAAAHRLRAAIERRAPPGPRWRRWLAGAAALLSFALALRECGVLALFGDSVGGAPLLRLAGALLSPALQPSFLASLLGPLGETVAVAVIGTGLGVALGGALALPASAAVALPPRDAVVSSGLQRWSAALAFAAARTALAVLRSIPELVWVPLCIVALGLGPRSGALALGLHTAGVLGRLYAEALENAPPAAPRALAVIGAGPLQRLLWGLWPLARVSLEDFTLLRLEANLRAATVVGLVGGGGLGLLLSNNLQLGFHDRAATLVLVIWGTVGSMDALAHRARAVLARGER
jgi:phosphonate transport system permease protein